MATADALARKYRRRSRRKLLLEAVAIFAVTAAAAAIVYFVYRHNIASPWEVAGTNVQNVSQQLGIQTEVSVAVAPSDSKVLFAASNESLEPEIRVYTSRNAGRTWSRAAGPAFDPNTCAWGDPAVAIAPDGRQYVAYTEKTVCAPGPDLSPYLVVSSRPGPQGPWTTRRVTRPAVKFGFDDRPSIAVGRDGRAYVAWSRLLSDAYETTVVSSSGDGGKTWTPPRIVSRSLDHPQLVSAAAAGPGLVYLTGVDAHFGIWVARSADGGRNFVVREAAPLPGNTAATCLVFGKYLLPQQSVRCAGPNPVVSAGKGRVYVTYGAPGADQSQNVAVAVLDPALRPLSRGLIGPNGKKTDQFWPASTVDAKTGRLWACFYDTTGDSDRKHAWFVCTSSRDGKRWREPVRATSTSANQQVLWQDALIAGYGDSGGWGGYVDVAAAGGVAHPLWIDTRDVGGNQHEIFGSNVRGY
jgi:hypothetical protein